MEYEFKKVTYSGDYLREYQSDRADLIMEGWEVADVGLTNKERYFNGLLVGSYVTGCVVYKRVKK